MVGLLYVEAVSLHIYPHIYKFTMVLNEKHHIAMEAKFKGESHDEIAARIEVPRGTVDDWFRSRGVLSVPYEEFSNELKLRRMEQVLEQLGLHDDEFSILVRRLYNLLMLSMVQSDYKAKMSDYYRLWKIMRVLQNKPTSIVSKLCPHCKNESRTYR